MARLSRKISALPHPSTHYSSTPILTQGVINPDIWRPVDGRNIVKNGYSQKATQEEQAISVSLWVEETARLDRSSSLLSSPSSNSSNTTQYQDYNFCPSSNPIIQSNDPTSDASLSPEEVSLIRSTYSSYKTTCFISSCLINLYTSTTTSPWTLRYTGVPTLLLNYGGTRARTPRGVKIILAERGTGFALWKDQLDNLSCYTSDEEDKLFHSLYYSKDHRVRVGLSWDQEEAAALFLARVGNLTSRPDNVGLSGPKTRLGVPGAGPRRRTKLDKVEISRPCGFRHNVSITMEDRDTYYSMLVNINTTIEEEKF